MYFLFLFYLIEVNLYLIKIGKTRREERIMKAKNRVL
jgi:hypothetical protein